MLGELRRLKNELVSEEELSKAKDHMIGSLMLGLETSDSVAAYYGMQELLTKDLVKPEALAKKIRAVTSEQIKEVANELFVDKNLNLAVIGPVGDKKALQEILKID